MSENVRQLDRLIGDRDVANSFGINRSCVWRWVDKGIIPKPIVSRHKFTRWSENQIQAAIEKLKNAEEKEMAS